MKQLAKLKALSLQEWRVLFLSLTMLPLITLSLQISGFANTRNLLTFFIPAEKKGQYDFTQVDVLIMARMVSIAAIYGPFRANCLKQSLLLWWLMMRRGVDVHLRIGVNNEHGKFNAHSWVEWNGKILIGGYQADKNFARLV